MPTLDEFIAELVSYRIGIGRGDLQVVLQNNLTYVEPNRIERVRTIYQAQNPSEVPEPFIAILHVPAKKGATP